MNKSKSNLIWYIIGGVVIIGGGIGAYLYFRKRKTTDSTQALEESTSVSDSTPSTPPSSGGGASSSSSASTPFKNKAEGDAFRNWVNNKYPAYAKEIDLDRSGSYDNAYIRKAYAKYGAEYSASLQSSTQPAKPSIPKPTANDFSVLKQNMSPLKAQYPLASEGSNYVAYTFKSNIAGFFYTSGFFEIARIVAQKRENVQMGDWWYDGKYLNILMSDGTKANGTYIPDVALQVINKKYAFADSLNMDGSKSYVDAQDSLL